MQAAEVCRRCSASCSLPLMLQDWQSPAVACSGAQRCRTGSPLCACCLLRRARAAPTACWLSRRAAWVQAAAPSAARAGAEAHVHGRLILGGAEVSWGWQGLPPAPPSAAAARRGGACCPGCCAQIAADAVGAICRLVSGRKPLLVWLVHAVGVIPLDRPPLVAGGTH